MMYINKLWCTWHKTQQSIFYLTALKTVLRSAISWILVIKEFNVKYKYSAKQNVPA